LEVALERFSIIRCTPFSLQVFPDDMMMTMTTMKGLVRNVAVLTTVVAVCLVQLETSRGSLGRLFVVLDPKPKENAVTIVPVHYGNDNEVKYHTLRKPLTRPSKETEDRQHFQKPILQPIQQKNQDDRYIRKECSDSNDSSPLDDTLSVIRLDKEDASHEPSATTDDHQGKPRIRLTHVWSPYVVWRHQNDTNDQFFPLDQAQNVTWGSMWRAKEFYETRYPSRTINIYCAILWMDVEILQQHQPPLCTQGNTLILDRSTLTEYPYIRPKIHYPFVNDILKLASVAQEGNSTRGESKRKSFSNYIIYSNSDIGVIKSFYTTLESAMLDKLQDHNAFQINRRNIAKEWQLPGATEPRLLSSNELELIDTTIRKNYTFHPGMDCFVVRKDILDGIDLGNLFLGQPPWAGVLKKILKDFMTSKYGEYTSRAGLTFHLGNDREWYRGGQNLTGTEKLDRLNPCVFPNYPKGGIWNEHRYVNTLNCAIISNGTEEFIENDGPFPPFMNSHAYQLAEKVQRVKRKERLKEKIQKTQAARKKTARAQQNKQGNWR
jgi:hypothetical protein